MDKHLKQEIDETRRQLKLAYEHFDNADPEFVEVAVFEIHALRKKLDVLIRKARGECA